VPWECRQRFRPVLSSHGPVPFPGTETFRAYEGFLHYIVPGTGTFPFRNEEHGTRNVATFHIPGFYGPFGLPAEAAAVGGGGLGDAVEEVEEAVEPLHSGEGEVDGEEEQEEEGGGAVMATMWGRWGDNILIRLFRFVLPGGGDGRKASSRVVAP